MSDSYRDCVHRALDAQVDSLRALHEPLNQRFVKAWMDQNAVEVEGYTLDQYAGATIATMTEAASLGECYAVTQDMCELLSAASHSVPSWKLQPADLPSSLGFAYFDGGLVIPDVKGRTVVLSTLLWNSDASSRGVAIFVSSNVDDPRDSYTSEDNDWANVRLHLPSSIAKNMLTSMSGWDWGCTVEETYTSHVTAEEAQGFKWVNVVAALWRLLGETYVEHRAMTPGKPWAKRATRGGVPEPKLRIVRLRREEKERRDEALPDGRPLREYSHRWMVQGHWRNQWYPSMQDHRPKYIPPHIKGPKDKPLVVHDVAYSLDR